ncbi:phospholipase A2 group XV [Nephila pilipes]|uniref:Phospholipase A2 group XV n=1 Tax=Nephila pilipes TaxID=299642 RepID=A0A8X6TBB1_NEPPI|nr:phospholipase A2 group XV [Nephila pilipes]
MFGFFLTFVASVRILTTVLVVSPIVTEGYAHHHKPECFHKRSPVILIPGDLGNQLDAKLNKATSSRNGGLHKSSGYFNIWLNPWQVFLPGSQWADHMSLVYNNQTRKTTNYPGVDIRVPGFGDTSTLEIIDPHFLAPHRVQLRHHPWTEYYKDIVTHLEVDMFYYTNMKDFPDNPKLLYGEGDGTVNLRSLNVCSGWKGRQKQKVFIERLPKVEHLDMMHNTKIRKFIANYATSCSLYDIN